MQRYYGVPCPTRDVIGRDLAGLPAGVELIVAETDRLVGFVTFSAIYPGPGLKSGFFMKELFVAHAERGKGIGTALIQAVAQAAIQRGHGRIDWTADRNNSGLLDFYSSLGAVDQPEKVFFRLSGDALASLARRTTE
jgi:GNAT superfamily N-acetyltransferase